MHVYIEPRGWRFLQGYLGERADCLCVLYMFHCTEWLSRDALYVEQKAEAKNTYMFL